MILEVACYAILALPIVIAALLAGGYIVDAARRLMAYKKEKKNE